MSQTRLTRRGWIVLVIIPAILLMLLLANLTHDICYVGTDKPYANFIGYGSCEKMIDDVLGVNK
jgi:hypothetical protein